MMTNDELISTLMAMGHDETVILMNPSFNDAIIGISDEGRLVYSYEKMIRQLSHDSNMPDEEAEEFIDYNTLRGVPYMGEKRPIIVYPIHE